MKMYLNAYMYQKPLKHLRGTAKKKHAAKRHKKQQVIHFQWEPAMRH